ncbi:hypothetical protein [uncultured Duncaniella sp.]|jgi:hypothetical protein|uniref:hypothetical protein n=1 Tax=uncultured Duncaniella sp. TaxID=2768039 RepID=UPI0025B03944|nr:hypothetical protein [uncultured Duncaniella sp.]
MNDRINHDQDYDKVIEMLTPRFPRKGYGRRRRRLAKIWTIGGIAAMFVLVITVAVKSVMPASANIAPASEIVFGALESAENSENGKIDFVLRGIETDSKAIYDPAPEASMVNATLYFLNKDGRSMSRIDWHDAEKNTVIFDGKDYIHLRNGIQVKRCSDDTGPKFKELFGLESLIGSFNVLDEEISEEGNIITVRHRKNSITFIGEFSRSDKKLRSAKIVAESPTDKQITIVETQSIDFNTTIPESMFVH